MALYEDQLDVNTRDHRQTLVVELAGCDGISDVGRSSEVRVLCKRFDSFIFHPFEHETAVCNHLSRFVRFPGRRQVSV